MHRLLLLFALLCAFAARVQAQEATVTGTVTNEDGSAAALTSVAVLGERSSVQADEEGNYTLLVPAGRPIVLRFSQAGNSTDRNIELVAGERRTINVTLKTGELPVAE
jgi:Ca-activated chloride channel family protein